MLATFCFTFHFSNGGIVMKLRPSLIFMPAGDQTGKNLRQAQVDIHKKKTQIHIHKHKNAFTNTDTNLFFSWWKSIKVAKSWGVHKRKYSVQPHYRVIHKQPNATTLDLCNSYFLSFIRQEFNFKVFATMIILQIVKFVKRNKQSVYVFCKNGQI